MMDVRLIPLTQGKVAIVDDADFEWLNQFKWCAIKMGNTWAAVRNGPTDNNGRQEMIYMHRAIMGLRKGNKRQVDHINHNGLDNRRAKLRTCTCQQNQWNYTKPANKSSKFKGVCRQGRGWVAGITLNKTRIYLGCFHDEIAAARVYDAKAIELFGEFAKPNFARKGKMS